MVSARTWQKDRRRPDNDDCYGFSPHHNKEDTLLVLWREYLHYPLSSVTYATYLSAYSSVYLFIRLFQIFSVSNRCWVLVVVLTSLLSFSFVLVGLALNEPLVLFGVVCASISVGFGEITFLSFTYRYDKSTVTGWSSRSILYYCSEHQQCTAAYLF